MELFEETNIAGPQIFYEQAMVDTYRVRPFIQNGNFYFVEYVTGIHYLSILHLRLFPKYCRAIPTIKHKQAVGFQVYFDSLEEAVDVGIRCHVTESVEERYDNIKSYM